MIPAFCTGNSRVVVLCDHFPASALGYLGTYYGGKNPIPGKPNECEGPENYKKAYRYVVDRVRARGASNIRPSRVACARGTEKGPFRGPLFPKDVPPARLLSLARQSSSFEVSVAIRATHL